jgi:hypothetical protein
MTSSLLPILHDRITHLADTLAELRRRVREAVAVEMGRVVSETVRDLLTALLRRDTAEPEPMAPYRPTHLRHDDWADEDEPGVDPVADTDVPATAPARSGSRFWPAVLSLGLTVARWLLRRHPPWWPAAGFGAFVAESPLVRHPLARSSLAVVATAAELVRLTNPSAAQP